MRTAGARVFPVFFLAFASIALFGCGSSSGSANMSQAQTTTAPVSNVQPISVNVGPASALGSSFNYVDGAFTSVTVCAPGSTTNCQTISGILVDTG